MSLAQMIDREKDEMQGEEVVELVCMLLAGPHPKFGTTSEPEDRRHRSKKVLQLFQQLQDCTKMSTIKPGSRSILYEEEDIAQELWQVLGGVMTSTLATLDQRSS